MTRVLIYAAAGILIFVLALYSVITRRDMLRRIIAANMMGAGVFLVFVSMAVRGPEQTPDPVPQAMVLTGIVVSVSATALGLALVRKLHAVSGQSRLPEDRLP